MANTNKKAARKETDREPIWKGAVQGASDAVGCFPTRNEQRRNAPDSPPALRVGAQSGVCGVVALGNGTTIAKRSALHPSGLGANAIRRLIENGP